MGEHDSLCSHALNNMTLNELAHTYADLKLENKRLREALTKIHDLCDEYWGELSGGIWSIPDDDYHAWYCRDLAYEALQGERARKALGKKNEAE